MTSTRALSYILLFLILIGLFGFLYIQENNKHHFEKRQHDADIPDIVLHDVTARHMNIEGVLDSALYSPKVERYSQTNKTDFFDPHVILYEKDSKPWHINAKHGQASNGLEDIELWGEVNIKQAKGENNHDMSLQTSQLNISPKKNLVQTDKAVTMEQPGSVIKSIGMRLFPKKGRVELLSQAHGHYQGTATQ